MKTNKHSAGKWLLFSLALCALALAGCAQEVDLLPRVWIDYPQRNLRVAPDQPLLITTHAYAESGLAEVVLSMDGVAYSRNQPTETGDTFSQFQQEWLPPGDGTYVLQVVAYDREGIRSNPATVTVVVGEQLAAEQSDQLEEQPPTPPDQVEEEPLEEAPADQPTCPPLVTVQTNANCRSGPGEFYPVLSSLPAGAQAQVIGMSQDSYWWVIEGPGGTDCWIWEELVNLSTQECQVARIESPPPPQDVTAPLAPQPAVPADGLSLSCRANQNLAWLPVQDESGIAGYDLKLEKELSPGNWEVVNVWSRIQGKQQLVTVDCGLRYRWKVRAEDGAGNFSSWSSNASFSVELD